MIQRVYGVYFSPCGSVGRVVRAMAEAAAGALGVPWESLDVTLPAGRERTYAFGPEALVFVGTPVYAGRVPNKLSPWLGQALQGEGALGVPAVCFGNRSFDDALMELSLLLKGQGFTVPAAAAVPARHVFSDTLAAGRPDQVDMERIRAFGRDAAEKARSGGPFGALPIPGNDPPGPYYTPLGLDGQPAKFLKAKPETDPAKCDGCGVCAQVCPMGSIPADRPAETEGICIKCHACIQKCPQGARHMADPAFLSHRAMLEQTYARPAEALFLV